ncbi:hypothetical protein C7C46_04215 [Streptomyces tateyamensis]|uniref:Zinc-finger domain-containing protein n=1 Tax=Streptomyces tateyamensis TaxID=565073 RepID=A0A2V4NZ83_9ACTN|nr:zf-HC2 domain-containing protein [Streptomyces tateyamensis]PYC87526.1 hypothetical protein C7C46_04215 [Streptomyces tateyamensis]
MTKHTPGATEPAAASHPSAEQLADLAEQLLPAAEAAELDTHLAGCAECADTLAALDELRLLLGQDWVGPMPPEVALRIDAALALAATEALPGPGAPGTPATAPRPAPAAPPARRDRATGPAGRSRARRRGLLVFAATAVAGLGLVSSAMLGLFAGHDQATGSSASAARPADTGAPALRPATGTQFSAEDLPAQIHQLLAGSSPGPGAQPHLSTAQGPDSATGGPLPPFCVRESVGEHQDESPLTVAHGSYAGAPVDAYVYRSAADRLDVFLVTPGCTTSPAPVLLRQQVPAS